MKKEILLADLSEFVKDFLNHIKSKDRAVIIGLCGDLGSGKTTFTKEIAKQLKINREITSPTFTVMQNYEIDFQGFKKMIHIDLYRFEKPEELKVLRLEELFADSKNLILIEWFDKFEKDLDSDFIKIIFHHLNDGNKREIEIIYG